jgi:hypothetical protein
MSRRSYTYEARLYKYAKRGFAIAVPGMEERLFHFFFSFDRFVSRASSFLFLPLQLFSSRPFDRSDSLGFMRQHIQPALLSKRPWQVAGLAQLILFEHSLTNPHGRYDVWQPKGHRLKYYARYAGSVGEGAEGYLEICCSTSLRLFCSLFYCLTSLTGRDEYNEDRIHSFEQCDLLRASDYRYTPSLIVILLLLSSSFFLDWIGFGFCFRFWFQFRFWIYIYFFYIGFAFVSLSNLVFGYNLCCYSCFSPSLVLTPSNVFFPYGPQWMTVQLVRELTFRDKAAYYTSGRHVCMIGLEGTGQLHWL